MSEPKAASRKHRLRRAAGAVLLATCTLTACTSTDRRAAPSSTTTTAPRSTDNTNTNTNSTNNNNTNNDNTSNNNTNNTAVSSTRTPRAAKSYDRVLRASVASIRAYWRRELPTLYGETYDDLSGELYAYSQGSAMPPCGGFSMPYVVMQQNAFYCPDNDFIAWDDQGLFPRLDKRYGSLLLGIVLAHEWGHAIQERESIFATGTIDAEQQSDCFAGSWAASLSAGTDRELAALRDKDLDRVLAGLVEFRDRLGVTSDDLGAHGSAFDRLRAFQDGYEGGADVCADYEDELPELVAIPFRSFKERFRGGNMPWKDVLSTLAPQLATYFRTTDPATPRRLLDDGSIPLCTSPTVLPIGITETKGSPRVQWCDGDQVIHVDRASLRKLYDTHGDFGVATVLALQWAAIEGYHESTDPIAADPTASDPLTPAGARRAICRVGAWTSTLYDADEPERSQLSPGDADEAVRVLLEITDDDPSIGTGFERVAAFRTGMLGGRTAC